MEAEPAIAVVVVEDHAAVRMGVEAILRRAGYAIAGSTEDPAAAHELVVRKRPNVALIDVNLPGGDGIELAESILRERPDQPILLYTGFENDPRLESVLSMGVKGVALKAGAPQELIDAVRAVASDGVYLDPRLRETLARTSSPERAQRLSAREREIFELLAQGFTGEDIATRLVLSGETVRTHVRNGMRRLGARTRAHALAIALTSGEIDVSRPGGEAAAGTRSSSSSSQTPA
jgi:DNA-binding NarL/FixJ family response regulator